MPPYVIWYIYASDGTNGFLLDLIHRPAEAVVRLAMCHAGSPPRVIHKSFPSAALKGVPDNLAVRLDGISLDASECHGALEDIGLEAQFALSGRSMRFVPGWINHLLKNIPDFRSHYGRLVRANVAGAIYGDAPLVYSNYWMNDTGKAEWVLLSAPRFEGTDLALELSATHRFGRWMASAWVFYRGREYKLNNPLETVRGIRIGRTGVILGDDRVFTATIRCRGLDLDIEARAPAEQFAKLDAEGQTQTWTTLLGACRVRTGTGAIFVTGNTCLLEVKTAIAAYWPAG